MEVEHFATSNSALRQTVCRSKSGVIDPANDAHFILIVGVIFFFLNVTAGIDQYIDHLNIC